jgi:hypothetical protein
MPRKVQYSDYKHVRFLCKEAIGVSQFGASSQVVERYLTKHACGIFGARLSSEEQALAKAGTLPVWLTPEVCKGFIEEKDGGAAADPVTPPTGTSNYSSPSPEASSSFAESSTPEPEEPATPEVVPAKWSASRLSKRALDKYIAAHPDEINARLKFFRDRNMHVRKSNAQLRKSIGGKMWAKLNKDEKCDYKQLVLDSPAVSAKKRTADGSFIRLHMTDILKPTLGYSN